MLIHLMIASAALVLTLPFDMALSQEVRDHRGGPQARGLTTAPQVRDHRTPQAAAPLLGSSEAANFQRQIQMLESRGARISSMSPGDRQVLENSTSSLLASIRRQIAGGTQGAFGGTLGAVDGTGSVSCLEACETEYSKCTDVSSEFLCDLQGAKCILKCAVD